MARKVAIYALADPRLKHRVKRFFYVGQTSRSLNYRLGKHISDRAKIGSLRLIEKLARSGVKPTIHLLARVIPEHAHGAEQRWITRLRAAGATLANVDREALSRKLRAVWLRPGYRKRRARWMVGARKRISISVSRALRRLWKDPVFALSKRVGMKAAWRRPEVRARHSAARRALWRKPEFRARMSRANRGAWSLARRRRQSSMMKKRWRTRSYRATHSQLMRAAWKRGAYAKRKSRKSRK